MYRCKRTRKCDSRFTHSRMKICTESYEDHDCPRLRP